MKKETYLFVNCERSMWGASFEIQKLLNKLTATFFFTSSSKKWTHPSVQKYFQICYSEKSERERLASPCRRRRGCSSAELGCIAKGTATFRFPELKCKSDVVSLSHDFYISVWLLPACKLRSTCLKYMTIDWTVEHNRMVRTEVV